MATINHTPGPWYVISEQGLIQADSGVYVVSRTERTIGMKAGEQEANNRLIAAAPELLAALETLLTAVEVDKVPGIGLATDKARAAIRKAIESE